MFCITGKMKNAHFSENIESLMLSRKNEKNMKKIAKNMHFIDLKKK